MFSAASLQPNHKPFSFSNVSTACGISSNATPEKGPNISLKQWQQLCLAAALQANGKADVFRAELDEALQVIPFDFQRLFCQ
ncbi:MAG: hypothetical protein ACFB10_06700, partial [Salibacteraceae bacterium]